MRSIAAVVGGADGGWWQRRRSIGRARARGSDGGSIGNNDSYWSSPVRLDGNGGSAPPRIAIVAGELCVKSVPCWLDGQL